ncbi:hypothetical protein DFH06DRAFT_1229824 [Mycena polygramma]|nr:hypothetical protein DFH06DRAFT_1229824 [Mycena polygramma]
MYGVCGINSLNPLPPLHQLENGAADKQCGTPMRRIESLSSCEQTGSHDVSIHLLPHAHGPDPSRPFFRTELMPTPIPVNSVRYDCAPYFGSLPCPSQLPYPVYPLRIWCWTTAGTSVGSNARLRAVFFQEDNRVLFPSRLTYESFGFQLVVLYSTGFRSRSSVARSTFHPL